MKLQNMTIIKVQMIYIVIVGLSAFCTCNPLGYCQMSNPLDSEVKMCANWCCETKYHHLSDKFYKIVKFEEKFPIIITGKCKRKKCKQECINSKRCYKQTVRCTNEKKNVSILVSDSVRSIKAGERVPNGMEYKDYEIKQRCVSHTMEQTLFLLYFSMNCMG